MHPLFLTLDEVAAAVRLTTKTLRNNLKGVRETIEVRGLPPLRTLRVGAHRLVARKDFDTWIADILNGEAGMESIIIDEPPLRSPRGRGRPPKYKSGKSGWKA